MDLENKSQHQQPELVSQGAEAVNRIQINELVRKQKIYKTFFLKDVCIVKERFKKSYRNPILDQKLRNQRTISESKNMNRARKVGVNTPFIMYIDMNECKIYMQYIEHSIMVKDFFYIYRKNKFDIPYILLKEIGDNIAKLHDADLVHGDLTTSNIMIKFNSADDRDKIRSNHMMALNPDNHALYIIDFGLSYVSTNIEDKAVDLYVLEKAFLSTHTESEKELEVILDCYKTSSQKNALQIIARLDEVRKRGRKKLAFG